MVEVGHDWWEGVRCFFFVLGISKVLIVKGLGEFGLIFFFFIVVDRMGWWEIYLWVY